MVWLSNIPNGVAICRNRLPDPKSGFSQTLLFLWFSIVSYNNYGGDSKLCFYKF